MGGGLKDPVTLLLRNWEVPRPPIIGEQLSLLALDPGVGSALHSLWAVAWLQRTPAISCLWALDKLFCVFSISFYLIHHLFEALRASAGLSSTSSGQTCTCLLHLL